MKAVVRICPLLAVVLLLLVLLSALDTHIKLAGVQAAEIPALPALADPRKEGYSRLSQYITTHAIARNKIPPVVATPFPAPSHYHAPSNASNGTTAATSVWVHLSPVDIVGVDSASQVLVFSAYVGLIWTDPDLSWNSTDYGGVTALDLTSPQLWTPSLTVLNGVEDSDLFIDARAPLTLYHTGDVILSFSVRFKTSCRLDLMFFPFDQHSCDVHIFSLTNHPVHLVAGNAANELLRDFSAGGEWLLTNFTEISVAGFQYRQNVLSIKATLTLKRKTTFYIVSMIIPMSLFTWMNCLVYLIPPESGEKISFLISIFISNTVFSGFISGVMPRGIDTRVPVLMMYLVFMWVWSVLTFLTTVLVLKRYHHHHHQQQQRQETAPTAPRHTTSPLPDQHPLTSFWSPLTRLQALMTKRRSTSNDVRPATRDYRPQSPLATASSNGRSQDNGGFAERLFGQTPNKSCQDNGGFAERLSGELATPDTAACLGGADGESSAQTVSQRGRPGFGAAALDRIFLVVSCLIVVSVDGLGFAFVVYSTW